MLSAGLCRLSLSEFQAAGLHRPSAYWRCWLDIKLVLELTHTNIPQYKWTVTHWLIFTIDGCFAGQNNDNQLKSGVCVLQVAKHRLHLVSSGCILTETRLTEDWHSCITGDLLQLLREAPTSRETAASAAQSFTASDSNGSLYLSITPKFYTKP